MAHYAFLDDNNVVTEVIVGKDENEDGIDWEKWYGDFRGQKCKRTSYNTVSGVHLGGGVPFRGNYAGIGYTYDEQFDIFLPPKPYESWSLNKETASWVAPSPCPNTRTHIWSEDDLKWIQIFSIGYPKSGNNFINFVYHKLANKPLSRVSHEDNLFSVVDNIVVPFRNPSDAVASLSPEANPEVLDWYISFYEKAIENKDKIVFANFEKFTTDKDYLLKIVGVPSASVTLEELKESMNDFGLGAHLPGEPIDRTEIKRNIESLPNYSRAKELFDQMLEISAQ